MQQNKPLLSTVVQTNTERKAQESLPGVKGKRKVRLGWQEGRQVPWRGHFDDYVKTQTHPIILQDIRKLFCSYPQVKMMDGFLFFLYTGESVVI
jgi:hypothetical protein